MSLISLKDVSFSYDKRPVLQDVTFDIVGNDFVSLVGPNGGGKTTLLKLILGFLTPTSGELLLFGKNPKLTSRRVGYMPQKIDYDWQFPITVKEVIKTGALGTNISKDELEKLFTELELEPLLNRAFGQLSGGEKQRTLLGRALAGRPELLILDEPTANIDAHVESTLLKILKKLNERMGILMVSHDLHFVTDSVKRVFCVNRFFHEHPTTELTRKKMDDLYHLRVIEHGKSY